MNSKLKYPQAVEKLIKKLQFFPGVGRRSAERFAINILEWPADEQYEFGELLMNLDSQISHCPNCGYLTEIDRKCVICDDQQRNFNKICVVENSNQLRSIEASGHYRGVYHILGGKISPLDGVRPEDLCISELMLRVSDYLKENLSDEKIEIVIALSADIEGQATISFLQQKLYKEFADRVAVSCLAQGLPAGADISYADSATLMAAFKGRNRL